VNVLTHPYALVLYGICLWELHLYIRVKKNFSDIKRSFVNSVAWGGVIISFDDEFIDFVDSHFRVLIQADFYFYIAAGFLIDYITSKFVYKDELTKQRERSTYI